jgi:hypothetical protein
MQNVESPEKILWCAYCFGCETVIAEDPDFWFVASLADLHADLNHHLVGIQTWIDKRPKKEVAACHAKS